MKQRVLDSDSGMSKLNEEKNRCVAWFKLADLVSRKEKTHHGFC